MGLCHTIMRLAVMRVTLGASLMALSVTRSARQGHGVVQHISINIQHVADWSERMRSRMRLSGSMGMDMAVAMIVFYII
jgi:hypothetical protein